MSWVSGIRNPGTQANADKTNSVVGPSKSAAEELVSRGFPALALTSTTVHCQERHAGPRDHIMQKPRMVYALYVSYHEVLDRLNVKSKPKKGNTKAQSK